MALGVERAGAQGSCVVALRNAGHIGRVGRYAETAVAAGLLSVHFVNVAGSPLVAPFGAVERRFSTAPLAIGVPLPDRPIVLDFATSLVAEGKVQVASYGGKPLPPDALIAPGRPPLGRPARALRRLRPHRPAQRGERDRSDPRLRRAQGLRAGADVRAAGRRVHRRWVRRTEPTSAPASATGCCRSTCPPDHFGTRADFERMGREYLDWVLAARPVDAAEPVLAPGDPEARTRAARSATGVPLPADTWAAIRNVAAELGVTTG